MIFKRRIWARKSSAKLAAIISRLNFCEKDNICMVNVSAHSASTVYGSQAHPSLAKVLRAATSALENRKRAREAYEISFAKEEDTTTSPATKKSKNQGTTISATAPAVKASLTSDASTTTASVDWSGTSPLLVHEAVTLSSKESSEVFCPSDEEKEEVATSDATPRPVTRRPASLIGRDVGAAVFDDALIQVAPMAAFEEAKSEVSLRPTHTATSSQSTASEDLGSVSPARSYSSTGTGPLWSPYLQETRRFNPFSRRLTLIVNAAPHQYRNAGCQHVPDMFAGSLEFHGYKSASSFSSPIPARGGVAVVRSLPPSPPPSSPGFIIVGDTTLDSAKMSGRKTHGQVRCNAASCTNARESRFCTVENCAFGGEYGNGLQENPTLEICRNFRNGMRGLVASYAIPAGEGPVNEGYRLHLKTRTTDNKIVGINALKCGGKLRLMNHLCNPVARFHEVQTGSQLAVVAVTIRDVFPGEEVTVSYGDRLWFVCRCGWWGCQHRDIQDLPDAGTPA
ncbi:hypothetical protein DVH05_012607 [Phytophthora capsici]|nr:hypothetical protein DVH05_012607 [Phytophthora capsici]